MRRRSHRFTADGCTAGGDCALPTATNRKTIATSPWTNNAPRLSLMGRRKVPFGSVRGNISRTSPRSPVHPTCRLRLEWSQLFAHIQGVASLRPRPAPSLLLSFPAEVRRLPRQSPQRALSKKETQRGIYRFCIYMFSNSPSSTVHLP